MLMSQIAPYRAYTGASSKEEHNMKVYSFLETHEVKSLIEKHGEYLLVDKWNGTKYVPVDEKEYQNIVK